jgi:hypothetical protein
MDLNWSDVRGDFRRDTQIIDRRLAAYRVAEYFRRRKSGMGTLITTRK